MKMKELMLKSLSALLEDGEELKYPVYGRLEEDGNMFFGYFGLTDTHLLVALVSSTGKQITYTARVPLDIRSVSVKVGALTKETKIDISFNDGAPCRIVLFPKVLLIDIQKDNYPRFIEILSSRAPKSREVSIKDRDGIRIRWQYFNTLIYFELFGAIPMAIILITMLDIKDGTFAIAEFFDLMLTCFSVFLTLIGPVIVLSVLNRFLFGKIVAVLDDKGVHLENDTFLWSEIKLVTYVPDVISRHHLKYCRAVLTVSRGGGENFDVTVDHFPLYGLRKIKRFSPSLEIEVKKGKWLIFLMPAAAALIISAIM